MRECVVQLICYFVCTCTPAPHATVLPPLVKFSRRVHSGVRHPLGAPVRTDETENVQNRMICSLWRAGASKSTRSEAFGRCPICCVRPPWARLPKTQNRYHQGAPHGTKGKWNIFNRRLLEIALADWAETCGAASARRDKAAPQLAAPSRVARSSCGCFHLPWGGLAARVQKALGHRGTSKHCKTSETEHVRAHMSTTVGDCGRDASKPL